MMTVLLIELAALISFLSFTIIHGSIMRVLCTYSNENDSKIEHVLLLFCRYPQKMWPNINSHGGYHGNLYLDVKHFLGYVWAFENVQSKSYTV